MDLWSILGWENSNYINAPKSISELSKKFAILMKKGNVNGALKLLTNNMSNDIIYLDDKT